MSEEVMTNKSGVIDDGVQNPEITDKPDEQTKNESGVITQEQIGQMLEAKIKEMFGSVDSKVDSKLSDSLKEYEKLANMTPDERKAYQLEKELEQYRAKEKEYQLNTNKAVAVQHLSKNGLSSELADFINLDDADQIPAQVEKLNILIDGIVKEKVEERIESTDGKNQTQSNMNVYEITPEMFQEMSLDERFQVAQKDPEVFNKLINQING